MRIDTSIKITHEFLLKNRDKIFVFGDNLIRKGKGGDAKFRNHPNTYGFITKKYPDFKDESYFTPEDYKNTYEVEIKKLIDFINSKKEMTFLIAKIGSNLANRFGIFEKVIEPQIKQGLKDFDNVIFLW